jgi:hypothetical protein
MLAHQAQQELLIQGDRVQMYLLVAMSEILRH